MDFIVRLAFDEEAATRLLNFLAREGARELLVRAMQGRPLPLLYESGVRYQREGLPEIFCDPINAYMQGHEDCDGLSVWRVAELMAWGWRALKPGDSGYEEAAARRLRHIPAEVVIRTRAGKFENGMYHCIPRYRIGDWIHWDDPSARLGMVPADRAEMLLSRPPRPVNVRDRRILHPRHTSSRIPMPSEPIPVPGTHQYVHDRRAA